jgi:hypothetical protein
MASSAEVPATMNEYVPSPVTIAVTSSSTHVLGWIESAEAIRSPEGFGRLFQVSSLSDQSGLTV